ELSRGFNRFGVVTEPEPGAPDANTRDVHPRLLRLREQLREPIELVVDRFGKIRAGRPLEPGVEGTPVGQEADRGEETAILVRVCEPPSGRDGFGHDRDIVLSVVLLAAAQ